MTPADALISKCNFRGRGSWRTFDDEVKRLGDSRVRSHVVAHALAARGYIEFDWTHDMQWVALPTNLIRLPLDEACAYLVVGALEADHIESIERVGIRVEASESLLADGLTFTQYILHGDVPGAVETLNLHADARIYFDHYEFQTPPAQRILDAIPPLWQFTRSGAPVSRAEIENNEKISLYSVEAFAFEEIQEFAGYELACIKTENRFESSRYYLVRDGEVRCVEREVGICATLASAGCRFFRALHSSVEVHSKVMLPTVFERVLFLSGAQMHFSGASRCYAHVPNSIAQLLSYRLGITPAEE